MSRTETWELVHNILLPTERPGFAPDACDGFCLAAAILVMVLEDGAHVEGDFSASLGVF
jgi:hypothetical protein